EVAPGVLGVDAELDAVPARRRVLVDLQRQALGDPELLADQVDADGTGASSVQGRVTRAPTLRRRWCR
ncbi:MAG TPA: hypothetical protein VGD53_30255, partial [Actinoallomurus sp.]